MTFDIGMPMVPELALFVLAVLVLFASDLRAPGRLRFQPTGGWVTLASAWVRGLAPGSPPRSARRPASSPSASTK